MLHFMALVGFFVVAQFIVIETQKGIGQIRFQLKPYFRASFLIPCVGKTAPVAFAIVIRHPKMPAPPS
jgi:hypothetical protein